MVDIYCAILCTVAVIVALFAAQAVVVAPAAEDTEQRFEVFDVSFDRVCWFCCK